MIAKVSSQFANALSLDDRRLALRILVGTATASWLIVLWTFNAARYLRPAADDYCIGIRGALGPLGGFVQDFQTFSGFVTPSFLTNLFVGLPLASGPIWLASSTTFIVASLAISLMVMTGLLVARGLPVSVNQLVSIFLILAPISMVGWWTYLWFESGAENETLIGKLAIGLTHWQNLNSAYVIPTAIILGTGTFLLLAPIRRNGFKTMGSGILGLVVGTMGPTFALAGGIFMIIVAIWIILRFQFGLVRKLVDASIFMLTIFLGFLIAYLSPGTQARADIYNTGDITFSPSSTVGWLMAVIPENLKMFGELLFQWGSVAVLLLFLGVGSLLTMVYTELRSSVFLKVSLVSGLFGICLTSATIVTDTFAYGAYWHSSSVAVVAYSVCASFGLWLGGSLRSISWSSLRFLAATTVLVGLISALGSSLDLSNNIVERERLWLASHDVGRGSIDGFEPLLWPSCTLRDLAAVNPRFLDEL